MRAFVVAAVVMPAAARADTPSVMVTLNAAGDQLAAEYGQSESELIMKAQASIENIYQTENLPTLLNAFANTAAFAARGLGADYMSDPDRWVFGVAATGALATDVSLGSSSHVVAGAVVNIGGLAGTSLARWGAPSWTVFANGSYEATTIRGLSGSLLTGGAHVQAKIVRPSPPGTVRWIGLDVTSGLDVADWNVGASAPIKINFHVTSDTDPSMYHTVDLASTGTLQVKARTYSVPVELTTGVLFWDTLGVYAGGGIDLTVGQSEIDAALSGTLTIDNDMEPIGMATITAA
ncbi:MAG TPA: hypothetical protein VMJ10_36890, partial [Kofleriaceae bacterium]|nr:hypothetical protein [Kofleriaceae bacterium]